MAHQVPGQGESKNDLLDELEHDFDLFVEVCNDMRIHDRHKEDALLPYREQELRRMFKSYEQHVTQSLERVMNEVRSPLVTLIIDIIDREVTTRSKQFKERKNVKEDVTGLDLVQVRFILEKIQSEQLYEDFVQIPRTAKMYSPAITKTPDWDKIAIVKSNAESGMLVGDEVRDEAQNLNADTYSAYKSTDLLGYANVIETDSRFYIYEAYAEDVRQGILPILADALRKGKKQKGTYSEVLIEVPAEHYPLRRILQKEMAFEIQSVLNADSEDASYILAAKVKRKKK